VRATRVFISYRRDDTGGEAGRIYDRLVERFGRQLVFRDVDSLEPGRDFVDTILAAISSTDVLLAVMGPRWLTATDAAGRSRLADERDLVRAEIATALARHGRVIPVLLRGAGMPRAEELPADLAGLSRRHAVSIRDSTFDHDVAQLLTAIEGRGWSRLRRRLERRAAFSMVIGTLVAAIASGIVVSGLRETPRKAGLRLAEMGLQLTADDFVERTRRGDRTRPSSSCCSIAEPTPTSSTPTTARR
jgi:hypothetical protein